MNDLKHLAYYARIGIGIKDAALTDTSPCVIKKTTICGAFSLM